jgi:PKD repeat protein
MVLAFVLVGQASGGSLASAGPAFASAGVTLTIVGTGFDASAAKNTVTFVPVSGAAISAPALSVLSIDATQKRLTVKVPSGLPAGSTALRVTNTTTGEKIAGRSIEVITFSADVASGTPGATLTLRLTGSANTQLTQTATRVTFSGTGVNVNTTTVPSVTSAVVNISVVSSATAGARDITIVSGGLTAILAGAFTVLTPTANHPPTVSAGGPYSAAPGQPVAFAGSASDQDGDAVALTWNFGDGSGPATGATPTHTYAAAGSFTATLTATDGKGGQATSSATVTITAPNRPPLITSSAPTQATEASLYAYQVLATDPDGDPLTFRLSTAPAGMAISTSGAVSWTPAANQVGSQNVAIDVSDNRGGTVRQSFTAIVAAAVKLTAIDLSPAFARFSSLNVDRAFTVSGLMSDGSIVDLTAAPDTTYESSSPFVATTSATGVVHSVGNGTATITVHHGELIDTAAVVIEAGVTLDSIDLSPASTTLRTAGAAIALVLNGHFSTGETRNLTTADGTTYASANPDVATIDATGRVVAVKSGDATITARNDVLTATASVHVAISAGTGLLRGAVRDDSKGLPLTGALVTLVADGGGPLIPPVTTQVDERGRFELAGRAGDAVVQVTKPGFTTVERRATIPLAAAVRLLDARLTPIDPHANATTSAFGATLHDSAGLVTAVIPPGGLPSNADLRLTWISGQGLASQLPVGWSPVAAVDISPAGISLGQPAALTVPNVASVAANTEVLVATYDGGLHGWRVLGTSRVSADGRSVPLAMTATGQVVCLLADDAPFNPPPAVAGDLLSASSAAQAANDVTLSGEVIPRSAPPGDQVRAIGRILLQHPTALPSGTTVQAHVFEQFDLADQSQERPTPFVEDVVLYSRGRPPGTGVLGAAFPIAPSRSYTIQQLLHGVISIDVTTPDDSAPGIVGAAGGTANDSAGDSLQIAPGLFTGDVAIGVSRVSSDATSAAVPAGFDLLAAIEIDLVGPPLAQSAQLSVAAPSLVSADDQLLVAFVFPDPTGAVRLRLVGVAALESGRIVSHTTVGALEFDGVRRGGQYMFLRSQQPLGFVVGQLTAADGSTAHPNALATTDSAPFADVSTTSGRVVVAAKAGSDVILRGLDLTTRETGTATGHVVNRNDVVSLAARLLPLSLTLTASTPAAGAVNVPLDTSIAIDFSQQVDAASVAAVALADGTGLTVAGQRTLSANRLRLVFTPLAPLSGRTTYTIALAGVKNSSGGALTGAQSVSFTTLDASKPTLGASGLITGDLPDEDGIVLITGGPGASASQGAVAATNLRTQETATVIALADGSFRVRLTALVGDQITLTLHDSSGRDTTVALTQLRAADGTTTVGDLGGAIFGTAGRIGNVLPRALTQPGLFRIGDTSSATSLPALPDGFSYADQFHVSVQAAQFNHVTSLTLTESQNRVAPQSATSQPFGAAAELTVPADFLINASLQFSAIASDASGIRRTAAGSTLVVGSAPATSVRETAQATDFPSIFLDAPGQAIPTQLVHVDAIAPTARIDLQLPSPAAADQASALLLARVETLGDAVRLSIVDSFTPVIENGVSLLRTNGRALPGLSTTGDYVVVASRDPLVFVTGRLAGNAATATVDGLPFIFDTDGPNGAFALPTRAGQPFTIRYVNGATGEELGSSNGQASATGSIDLGQPMAPSSSQLHVSVEPDATTVVDINAILTFTFSEPVDARTVASGLIVTDGTGARTFGAVTVSPDGVVATFKPTRRWRYGTKYRWGVSTTIVGVSGARLALPAAGEFTTFAPRIISTTATAHAARDVAAAGALSVVASEDGLTVFDFSSPLAPVASSQLPLTGGARGIALLPQTSFTDRSGQTHSGTFAAIVDGDAAGIGKLDVVDLTTATTPAIIGSAQLSASGAVPNAVVLTADQRAIVAVQNVGAETVRLTDAVPPDPSNAGRALGPRYPASAAENINQVAVLGDRLVTAGAAGLTVLDAVTLARKGGISTGADARSVAALPAFSVDLNGDGTIAPSETFDLAVVANGADGTLQLFNVPESGDPTLLSVVRFQGETTGVALDAAERLAYVGLGVRGVAIVDLDGPASVQPLDTDRNGVDDRVLAVVDTPGEAGRIALALSRGIAFVADGSSGLTAIELLPPRTTFLSLTRDPVQAVTGEEQAILSTNIAYLTDDRLLLTVDVLEPPGDDVVLAIDENVAAGVPRMLAFAGGGVAAPLAPGLNDLSIVFDHTDTPSARTIQLSARTPSGALVAAARVQLLDPDPGDAELQGLRLGPRAAVLTAEAPTLQIGVAGIYDDGQVFNLTASGTDYSAQPIAVATVDPSGLATGMAGGLATIVATNGAVVGALNVRVQRDAVVTELRSDTSHLTMRTVGERSTFPVVAVFSDGSEQRDISQLTGLVFSSADPAVATIAPDAAITAVGAGTTRLVAAVGQLQTALDIAVDPRTPSSITGIAIGRASETLAIDDAPLFGSAVVTGTGALDGLPVSITVNKGGTATTQSLTTNISGAVEFLLDSGDFSGSISVAVSVTDPATAATRSDAATFQVAPAAADHEPNDDISSASALRFDRTITGSLDGVTDRQDTFRLDAPSDGVLEIDLQLPNGVPPDAVVIISDAAGHQLAQLIPNSGSGQLIASVPAGAVFVSIQSSSGPMTYTVGARFVQADVAATGVSPMAGAPGTLVTIDGSGFSTRLDDNQVFFSSIAAEVVSATPTRLQVRVPANAVDGAVEIVSGDRSVQVPGFAAGAAVARPAAYLAPGDPAAMRQEPTSGALVDIRRLLVTAKPSVAAADMSTIATGLSGAVVGYIPLTNQYVVEFSRNQTLDGLSALRSQLGAQPGIVDVALYQYLNASSPPSSIDVQNSGNWLDGAPGGPGASRSAALDQISLFDAVNLVRSTPAFSDRGNLRDVRVAIIDTGFNPPAVSQEFEKDGQSFVEYLELGTSSGGFQPAAHRDAGRHGTQVASVIGARNDGNTILSGVLNSLVDTNEDPFHLTVYGVGADSNGHMPAASIAAALDHIKARTDVVFDVVNLSLGGYTLGSSFGFPVAPGPGCPDVAHGRAIHALRGRSLIVAAAGNDGVEARCSFPAAMERTEPHVVSVGAVAVANLDNTGEGPDARALFVSTPGPDSRFFQRCDSYQKGGSNCSPGVTLAAPGEDVLALSPDGYTLALDPHSPTRAFGGTSAAAPIVTGVAAILQAIRPTATRLPPGQLRTILTSTATDISSTWDTTRNQPQAMVRVNALAAVESLLPFPRTTTVFVADNEAPNGTGMPGAVVALEVDPVTAKPSAGPGSSKAIGLTVVKGGQTLVAGLPRTMVMAPDGLRLYVFASSVGTFGDGILIIDTTTKKAIDFVPLSGASFPAKRGQTQPRAFNAYQPRPPMAISKDGRLLYVSTGTGLRIVNLVLPKVVGAFSQMPRPFDANAANVVDSLQTRFDDLEQTVVQTGHDLGRGGADISALRLSPDGRALYLIVNTGRGTGVQTGYVLSLDVNLYSDDDPKTPALESKLSHYLVLNPKVGIQSAGPPGSDEPSAAAITPDGKFLYVVNGGVESFSPATNDDVARHNYALNLLSANGAGTDPNLLSAADALAAQIADGLTLVNAPGVIDVFNAPGLDISTRYVSDVNAAWQPSAASGGPVLSPIGFLGEVFAKRPMDIAMRPDGGRALLAYYESGNFGVLDHDGQTHFAGAGTAAPGFFAGVVGVTPSIKLDKNLWPFLGASVASDGTRVPSPDERLLFPGQIEYAQNGRFAAAVHTGAGLITDSGGGGALSIIDDSAITGDIASHAAAVEQANGHDRPYYAALPVCAERPPPDPPFDCATSAVNSLFSYLASDGVTTIPFDRPVAVAIAPIVTVSAPRFGDPIRQTTDVIVRWAPADVTEVVIDVLPVDASGDVGAAVGGTAQAITGTSHSFKTNLAALFFDLSSAPSGSYRIVVVARTRTSIDVSRSSIDVTYIK